MKILMLNDFMDSPSAHWRGAQNQTRLLSNALGACINHKDPKIVRDHVVYPDGGWDIINYQCGRSLYRDLRDTRPARIATVRWHKPVTNSKMQDRYNEMDGIIAISHYVKDQMVRHGVAADKIKVIYPCVEKIDVPPKYMKRRGFTICFAGALEVGKGISPLMYAIKSLSNRGSEHWIPGFGAWVCGVGRELKMWRDFAHSNGLPVTFPGLLEGQFLRATMASCDLFVLPSVEEALGSVLLEAMMLEMPIVASNVGGIPEVITHEKIGLLVEPNSPTELVEAIYKIYKNPGDADRMAANGRAKACKYFNVDRIAKATRDYYKDILSTSDPKQETKKRNEAC